MADDNATIQQMRERIKELERENKELLPFKSEVMENRKVSVAKELGFGDAIPKGLLTLHGDGEFSAEALRKTAEENGWNLPDPTAETEDSGGADAPLPQGTLDRLGAQRQMDEVRSTATPQAGQRMSFADFQTLTETDGAAALAAWQSGQVEVPEHVASQIDANNRQTSTLLGR